MAGVDTISLVSAASAVIALGQAIYTQLASKRAEERQLKAMEERIFDNVLMSDDVAELGRYLDETLGTLTISEYCGNREMARRADSYISRIGDFVGTATEIAQEKQETEQPEPRASSEEMSVEFAKVVDDLRGGEVWNALARVRRHVELRLKERAGAVGITVEGHSSAGRLLTYLERNEAIQHAAAKRLRYAIAICNRAIHGEEVTLDEAESAVYNAASGLAEI